MASKKEGISLIPTVKAQEEEEEQELVDPQTELRVSRRGIIWASKHKWTIRKKQL